MVAVIYILGTILLITSIVLTLLAGASYFAVMRGNNAALMMGRVSVVGGLVAVGATAVFLAGLFVARRFDIAYVNSYSSVDLDVFFTIAASWAGQPGSFLVWALWNAIVATVLIRRSRHFEPYVLAIFMVVQAALLGFILMLNPFAPQIDVDTGALLSPADGQGLNPLLHNFWMIIHPPILFLGYALVTAPFAFAMAALLRYDYDTWVSRALPWILAAWSFLGLALLLGGYWAYETLGWGGYWGWDPVENSSLVPWLLLTALLHGMVLQRAHSGLRRTNMLLALLAYVMVFYATFLTHSGVYANFSVHSFVAEGIYEALLGFLLLLIIGSSLVLALRWRDIPTRPLSDKFFSRDSFFVLALLVMVTIAAVVGLGTSMPVISAIPGVGHSLQQFFGVAFDIDDGTALGGRPFADGRFSLTPAFFQQVTPPLGIIAVALLTVGPVLGWRDANLRHLVRALRWPAVMAVVAACGALVWGVRGGLALAYITLGVFAVGTNAVMITRMLRSGWLRIGGYLAHVGFCVLLIGVLGSSVYASPEERVVLGVGDSVRMYGFDLTFNGWRQTSSDRGVLDLTVRRGSNIYNAQPQLYFDERVRATVQTPAILSLLWQDLYISPADYIPEVNPNRPDLFRGDRTTAGPYEITFVDFTVDRDAISTGDVADVGATLKVRYKGQEQIMTPHLRLVSNPETTGQTFQGSPVILPGGHAVSLVTFNPDQRRILLDITGLDLPVEPARAVVTVSAKPAVLLVWAGAGIGIVGGVIAIIRRHVESAVRLGNQRVRRLRDMTRSSGWQRLLGVMR
jgi:cytochrome c-type biogenesis protein CcmF